MDRWWPETIKRKPVYADDSVVFFHCDAREILLALPDKSIDHTITDPPYEDASHTYGKLRDEKGRIALSRLSFEKIEESLGREFTSRHLVRVTREWLLACCETEAVGDWKRAMEKWGAMWSRAQWWEKPDGAPQVTGHKPGVPGEAIATAWCSPGTMSTWNGGGLRGFYSVPVRESESRIHETQKPLALMVKLLELFTKRGQIIFDPFGGAGTTAKACKVKGRRCILIERDDTNGRIQKVINRLKMTAEQPTLFSEAQLIAAERPRTAGIGIDGQDLTKKIRKPRGFGKAAT
jgi:site-specific DNA-methyltransferase (adenine-specific)